MGQFVFALALFGPGTLHFWQGWVFTAVAITFCAYFYRRDPQLLERRLLRKEKSGTQKIIIALVRIIYLLICVLCGLDNRFGWSGAYLTKVPPWLTLLALLLYAGCYFLFIPVMTANRFAASIIQIEAGQTVADTGPYRLVRHPMYAVSLVLFCSLPLALGSFIALPFATLLVPILIWRLLDEEKLLQRDLPGYAEYCHRTPCRLIPFVW